MFDLVFGAAFIAFSLVFIFAFIGNSVASSGFTVSLSVPIVVIGIFFFIGLMVFIKGVRKIWKNIKTSKNGEEGYAILKDIVPTGSRVNGMPEMKGVFLVYILSLNRTETQEEIIGFNPFKYKVNDYVRVKYYDGDINIIEKISDNQVPSNVKRQLGGINEFSSSSIGGEDIININGHNYKRID